MSVTTTCGFHADVVDLRDVNAVNTEIEFPAEIIVGQQVEFNSQTTNATDAVWILDQNTIADGESFNHTFTEVGQHHLLMFAYNNFCFDDATLDFVVKAAVGGIETTAFTPDVVVLINVENGIELQFNSTAIVSVELYNPTGQLVYSENVNASTLSRHFLSTESFATGAYALLVKQQDHILLSGQIVK